MQIPGIVRRLCSPTIATNMDLMGMVRYVLRRKERHFTGQAFSIREPVVRDEVRIKRNCWRLSRPRARWELLVAGKGMIRGQRTAGEMVGLAIFDTCAKSTDRLACCRHRMGCAEMVATLRGHS